jgi:hypothetical protein
MSRESDGFETEQLAALSSYPPDEMYQTPSIIQISPRLSMAYLNPTIQLIP